MSNKMNYSDDDQKAQDEEAKCKQKNRGKKRKRVASESSTDIEDVLPENSLEVEKNLHASAIKNNLDDVSVKKILKKVVTNDHVLALVKLREEEEDSGTEENLQPKITRAKAKELMKVSPKSAPWNLELTPIKHIPVKTRPEVKALIAQELPDDEDDEEYEPTNDDVPSDDDHVLESSSDVDSLPRTPVTPRSLRKSTPKVVSDGPFKVPQQEVLTPARRKLVLEEEATIALRTRSKLSLSATSIEHIESSFVPPDDLPMPDVDSLWNDFLKDCLNPASNARNEDDDEADPEYNVAADPDANDEDEESLENTIIKISKKELNDLVTELFNIMPEGSEQNSLAADTIPDSIAAAAENLVQDMLTEHDTLQADVPTRWEGKQEPDSGDEGTVPPRPAPVAAKTQRFSIGKEQEDHEEPQPNDKETHGENTKEQEPMDVEQESEDTEEEPVESSPPAPVKARKAPRQYVKGGKRPPSVLRELAPKPQPIRIEIQKDTCHILPEQRAILQQQLRQHVQLATGYYLQLYVHPTHWARAPVYKDYLESLEKMAMKVPTSIVNVCNLKPALELIASWETAVSANTKENLEMVKFIREEEERNIRRQAHNAYYVGDFPELFMQVVANSSVFLYPHLLPHMPIRKDLHTRRATYLESEDHLITLGLDQFWDYVYANPEIYKRPTHTHPRHRWGLTPTLQLVCKHMMPWLSPRTLIAHVRHVKKGFDKDNPIYKFFESRTVLTVRHRLLPFGAALTLYDQPAHEVPRIWLRYLAKTSARFRKHLYSRQKKIIPGGVEVDIDLEAPKKKPLPIDFNKKIPCSRANMLPKQDEVTPVGRIDVTIQPVIQPMVAKQIFTVLSTSNGSFLVPLQMQTTTVNSTSTPVCSTQETTSESPPEHDNGHPTPEKVVTKDTEVEGTKTAEKSDLNCGVSMEVINTIYKNSEHCSCCVQMRKICKRRKTIVDYFKGANKSEDSNCFCKGRRYPRITNRLKLLIKNYRMQSKNVFEELEHKLVSAMNDNDDEENKTDPVLSDDDDNDLVTATLFHLKLTTMTAVARNNMLKKRIHTLFSKFDVHTDAVLTLATKLRKLCEGELMEVYKEFTGFLTAEQADALGQFHDYFVQRCLGNLIKKIEELVPEDRQKRCSLLWYIKSRLFALAPRMSACELCSALLWLADGCAPLVRYVFQLFPHQWKTSEQKQKVEQSAPKTAEVETAADDVTEPVEPAVADDNDADHSDDNRESDEDNEDNTEENVAKPVKPVQYVNKHESTPVKVEEEEIGKSASMTEVSNDASDMRIDVQSNDTTDMSSEQKQKVEQSAPKTAEVETATDDVTEPVEPAVADDNDADHSDDNRESDEDNEGDTEENVAKPVKPVQYVNKHESTPVKVEEEQIGISASMNEVSNDASDISDMRIDVQSNDTTDMSRLVMSDDEIKSEWPDWKREEDKVILEVLKQHLTPEERGGKTIFEVLEETHALEMISESLQHKSRSDVKGRILYLLQLLVNGDLLQ